MAIPVCGRLLEKGRTRFVHFFEPTKKMTTDDGCIFRGRSLSYSTVQVSEILQICSQAFAAYSDSFFIPSPRMSRDTVAEVAAALKNSDHTINLSKKVLEQTRSDLRGLQHRNPGSLQKQDNNIRRACALLEYIAREEAGIKLPMDKLASTARMKANDFKKFHQLIGNFRTKKPTKGAASNQKSSIPSLAMKLGSHVTDSNGVAIRAQRLLGDIARFYRRNRDLMTDIVQNSRTYEAVCFFIVATQDTRKDDPDEKQLKASTVVDVSTDFTLSQFANFEEHVRKLVHDMKENEEKTQSTSEKNKKRKTDETSSFVQKPQKRTTKRSMQAATSTLELVEERAMAIESMMEDPLAPPPATLNSYDTRYSPKFVAWKDMILAQSLKLTSTRLEASCGDGAAGNLSRDQLLQEAAFEVLQSHTSTKL